VALEVIGGLVAHQLEGIAAPISVCLPPSAFQLDGFDLAAILFPLGALLRQLVIVEFAFDPVDGPVKTFTVDQSRSSRSGSRRVSVSATTRASKMSEMLPARICASGSGRGSARPGKADSHRAGVREDLVGLDELWCGSKSSWSVVIAAFLRRIGRAHRSLHGDEGAGERTCTRSAAEGRSLGEGPKGTDYLVRDVSGPAADGK